MSEAPALEERVRRRLAGGDVRGAAEEALRELGPGVLRFLGNLLHDEGEAGEAFSLFAERLWSGLAGFRGGSSLRTWAFRIAWNAAASLRDDAWRRKGRPFATGEASAIAEEIRTRTAVRLERQRDALHELRRSLSAEEQSLLTLRIEQSLSWAEIAEVLSSPEAPVRAEAVAKRFDRLKERLARMAREQGLLG